MDAQQFEKLLQDFERHCDELDMPSDAVSPDLLKAVVTEAGRIGLELGYRKIIAEGDALLEAMLCDRMADAAATCLLSNVRMLCASTKRAIRKWRWKQRALPRAVEKRRLPALRKPDRFDRIGPFVEAAEAELPPNAPTKRILNLIQGLPGFKRAFGQPITTIETYVNGFKRRRKEKG
jgi:hypothetical protein